MNKNRVYCLIVTNNPRNRLDALLEARASWLVVETIDTDFQGIARHLHKNRYQMLIIPERENLIHLEKIKKLLCRYSKDTLLVITGKHSGTIHTDISGIDIVQVDIHKSAPECFAPLIDYARLKKDFRQSKQLLRLYDQLNRWLVETSHEPFAYIHHGSHIFANRAWLSQFEFTSTAQLLATDFMELVPEQSRKMLQLQMKKAIPGVQQKLVMTLNKLGKEAFRAELRLTPAVIRHIRCLQISARPLPRYQPAANNRSDTMAKPAKTSITLNKRKDKKVPAASTSSLSPTTLLQLPKARQGIKLYFQSYTQSPSTQNDIYHVYMGMDSKLKQTLQGKVHESDRGAFLDELILRLLFDKSAKEKLHNHQYIVATSPALVTHTRLRKWFLQFLTRQADKSPTIHLLFPASLLTRHFQHLLHFQESVQARQVTVGIRDYSANRSTIRQIKKLQPRLLSFSDDWLRVVNGSSSSQRKLRMLVSSLEDAGIEVILPMQE